MDIQRLRTLTTGLLHSDIQHVYEDLEYITGERGLMTHMLPNICRACEPWLKSKVTDERFWNGLYDPSHVGDYPLEPMSDVERKEMAEAYSSLPNPFDGKEVIAVVV